MSWLPCAQEKLRAIADRIVAGANRTKVLVYASEALQDDAEPAE